MARTQGVRVTIAASAAFGRALGEAARRSDLPLSIWLRLVLNAKLDELSVPHEPMPFSARALKRMHYQRYGKQFGAEAKPKVEAEPEGPVELLVVPDVVSYTLEDIFAEEEDDGT